jgi:hypothetical protein
MQPFRDCGCSKLRKQEWLKNRDISNRQFDPLAGFRRPQAAAAPGYTQGERRVNTAYRLHSCRRRQGERIDRKPDEETFMRNAKILTAAIIVLQLAANQAWAVTDWRGYHQLGGVNLNSYCQKTFGNEFKSVLVGQTAGDWTCQRNQNDRREISVERACGMQYNIYGVKARANDWNDPLSWVCMRPLLKY